ncbi:GDSL family lipase, partial [bacterium]
IGTNNMALSSADEIVKADRKIVSEIHRRLPDTKVLLLGIFPRAVKATDPARAKIKSINAELAKLDDGGKTRFLDIGDKFLEADGSLSAAVMPDALHPSPKGYVIWADAMSPLLDEMMK